MPYLIQLPLSSHDRYLRLLFFLFYFSPIKQVFIHLYATICSSLLTSMGKSAGKNSHSQVHSMRARFCKASCMNDDSYGDDDELNESLHPQPWLPMYEQENAALSIQPDASHQNGDVHEQLESAFYTRLPGEIRRMIYTELWRSSNPLMKVHMHGSANGPNLITTPCQHLPKATFSTRDEDVDPMRTDPWPTWRSRNQPPRWFWHAWGLRLRWGVHWKCQAVAMLDWRPSGDGTCEDLRRADGRWMGCFLTCRKMCASAFLSSSVANKLY